MKHIIYILCLFGVVVTSCSSGDEAAVIDDKNAKMVKVAVTPTMDCLPLYVAQEIGLDRGMGFELVLQEHQSKADCDTAIVGGSVDAIVTDYLRADVVKENWVKLRVERLKALLDDQAARRKGKKKAKDYNQRLAERRKYSQKDSLYIFPHENTQIYLFASSRSRVREAKQLTDKIIGVDRQGVDMLMAQHLLDSVKLTDEKAFLVQVQSYAVRQKMLFANTLDAAVLFEPHATYARKIGHRSLYSVTTFNGRPIGCILTKGKAVILREAYNRACDSINKNGIHKYDSVIQKRYGIPATVINSIPTRKFTKV